MTILYKAEHLSCYLYDNEDNPLIVCTEIKKGETFVRNEIHNQILFLLKGKLNFSYKYQVNNILEAENFVMFPSRQKYLITTEEDCAVVIMNLHHDINFCHHFPLEMLYELNDKNLFENSELHLLKINKRISEYLDGVIKTFSDGLKCTHYQDLKQKELLYYLRVYYSKRELASFFAPILNSDMQFSKMIYENYESAKNIKDLANLTNYSVSGFKKRFVKVFGISPQAWIEKEKAKKIHYEINCTQKSFKEIAVEYDFSSMSHFSKFCKKVYGNPPSILRENTQKAVLFDEQ